MAAAQLCDELKAKLVEYRKTRNFQPKQWVEAKTTKFNDYMKAHGLSGCVVSLSGGIDSAVTLGLMAYASKQEGSPIARVLAVNQPIHSSDWALNRSIETAAKLGAELIVVDQTPIFDSLVKLVDTQTKIEGKHFATGQMRSYMRTPVGYYVAQLVSQAGNPCVVMGTGNQDEDGYLAYFCKAGDGVVDVQLLSDLHKSEVFEVARELNIPDSTINAAPSADLWDGQTDEEELGFTYDFIELFTGAFLPLSDDQKQAFKESLGDEATKQFSEWSAKCESVHRRNKHKLSSPVNL